MMRTGHGGSHSLIFHFAQKRSLPWSAPWCCPIIEFVLKNYGENPEAYNEEMKKLELLRQNAVRVPWDFEGCNVLCKYLGQLHYLQSRVPMGSGQEAAVPVTW
ncbi:hypothetical protein MC885_017126 [Smutsia gigantea]|nr:hypothetical protein MC885_017126 [Smutsia gigantea]